MSLDSLLRATGKNLLPNPNVHAYNYSSDYKKYNNTDEIFLTAGTYSISVSANCPTLQFWNVTTKQQYTVNEVVSAYSTNTYYKIYEGYALGRASDAVRQMWFTLKINSLITLNSGYSEATSQECQIEKGSTATTYEPYEYLGPKTINLGSGSSGKEVLKVSYNSRNLFNKSLPIVDINVTATAVRQGYRIPVNAGTYTVSGGSNVTFCKTLIGDTYGTYHSLENAVTLTLNTKGYILIYSVGLEPITAVVDILQLELGDKKTDYVPYFNAAIWTKINA